MHEPQLVFSSFGELQGFAAVRVVVEQLCRSAFSCLFSEYPKVGVLGQGGFSRVFDLFYTLASGV